MAEKKQKKQKAPLHWAQQMALEIKKRISYEPKLAEIYEKQGILVYDEKTPSGTIHIGSGRGWLIHDVVAKCLRDLGLKAQFILSSDDFDPYDKPNKDLDPAIYNEHLGKPFCDIPSPVEGFDSFGDYYFKQSTVRFAELGIECGFESTADNYRKGLFNPQIKTILDNVDKVHDVYRDLYGDESEGSKKMPFNVLCPECGKIATTVASKWDKEKEELYFECKKDVVEWADGCGHSGWISPYNGGGKFPWKVEWAAKWPTRGVIVEFGGKDHFSKGGSRTCANQIAMDVLDFPPPYPSHGYKTGPGYEFFQIGGAKMSTSKGKGMSFSEGVDFFPSEMLRFLLLKSKPNSVVDFDPEKNDILLLSDHYDRMERIHFGIDEASEFDHTIQSSLFRLTSIGEPRDFFAPQIPINLASTLLQVTLSTEKAIDKLVEMGHIEAGLEEKQLDVIRARFALAKKWVDNFASEQFIFKLVSEGQGCTQLNSEQIAIAQAFCEFLEKQAKGLSSKELHNSIYDFARSIETEVKEVFLSAYMSLINKDRGPQLANFIMTIGVEQTIKLIKISIEASQ
ncbi:MAG: lysine--tRNA ligase [Planctomycetes bacterium]|nr:lysine--tRNA ligase [Planctomycetota bacterium]